MKGSRKPYPCVSCGEPIVLSKVARLFGLFWLVSWFGIAAILDESHIIREDAANMIVSLLVATAIYFVLVIVAVPIKAPN